MSGFSMFEQENEKVSTEKHTHTTHSILGILITCCKNVTMTVTESLSQAKHAALARCRQCANYVRDDVFFPLFPGIYKSQKQTPKVLSCTAHTPDLAHKNSV